MFKILYANHSFEMQTLHPQVGGYQFFSAMRQSRSTNDKTFRFPSSSSKCYHLDIRRRKKKNLTCCFSHHLRGKEYCLKSRVSRKRHYRDISAKSGLSTHSPGTWATAVYFQQRIYPHANLLWVLSNGSSNFCDNTWYAQVVRLQQASLGLLTPILTGNSRSS